MKCIGLILVAGEVFVLIVGLFFLLCQSLYTPTASPEEIEDRRFTEYVNRFGLSIREQEIFALINQGMSNCEIAAALFITESTVKFHTSNIFKKTGLANRTELTADYKLHHRV